MGRAGAVEPEKRDAGHVRRLDLRVITPRGEVGAGRCGEFGCLGRASTARARTSRRRAASRLDPRRHDDEAASAEHALEETSEGVSHADARFVGGADRLTKRVAELSGRKNLLQFDQDAVNLLVDRNGGYWDRIARSSWKGAPVLGAISASSTATDRTSSQS
mgnify:CR=1 FL=1